MNALQCGFSRLANDSDGGQSYNLVRDLTRIAADTVSAYLELYHATPLFVAPHEFRKKVLHRDFLWNRCATVDHESSLLPV